MESDQREDPFFINLMGELVMKTFLKTVSALLLLVSMVTPALSQSSQSVKGDDLKNLATGRSWAISFVGNPDNPRLTLVWDFRKDGSVCARAPGQGGGEKCADQGSWAVKGDMMCWDLKWLGKSMGYKTACSLVKKVGEDRFELHNEKTPEIRFAALRLL